MKRVDLVPHPLAVKGVDPLLRVLAGPGGGPLRGGGVEDGGEPYPCHLPGFGAAPPSPPPRHGNGRHQAQPGHRARVVTFRQRQPFPWGEPGRVGPLRRAARPRAPGGRDGGGGRRNGAIWFSHPWLPLGLPPRLLSQAAAGRQGTRGCPGLGPRPEEKRARSRGRALVGARAPAVIGRHRGGSFLSAPLCFALWF